ncbi:hypothetical protein [Nocardia niwae]
MNSETTKRLVTRAAQSSAVGGTLGRPMRAQDGEPDHSRLQILG